jgi:DNA-binding SARP family transcriptional activator
MTRDGQPVRVRGRKTWGLLALLALRREPPSRRRLAELLFPDADDPLGALRWNLAQLRGALGAEATLGGDPVTLQLGQARLDADVVLTPAPAGHLPALAALPGELLEGLDFDGCPAFEAWLAGERRRVAGAAQAMVRELALTELTAGRAGRAVELTADLVAADPLDESHQVLLVRALAASGDAAGALAQVERCERLFATELGVTPGPHLRGAAATVSTMPAADGDVAAVPAADGDVSPAPAWPGHVRPAARLGRSAISAQLDAGRSAVAAGAAEVGIERIRQAAAAASSAGEIDLEVEALVAIGSALLHTVRGRNDESAAALHRAVALGDGLVDPLLLAHAHRKLATIDLMVGRRARAEAWFASAEALAGDDDAERSSIAGWRGFNLTDMGRYHEAMVHYGRSLQLARRSGHRRQVAWTETSIGRIELLRGDLDAAAATFDAAIAHTREEHWTAYLPFPEVLRAEVDRRRGDLAAAEPVLEHAHAMSLEVGDPCWIGLSSRGLGLVAAEQGDTSAADGWLDVASRTVLANTQTNRWVQSFVSDGRCRYFRAIESEQLRTEAHRLLDLATRTSMPEVVVRAQLHLDAAGERGALDAAGLVLSELDNPELTAEMSERLSSRVA